MLEGLVYRVLTGYLGQYVKDFSKDQVNVSKGSLRNVAVELKDIELILEAFDYLQLPFALKQGRVGKLSVKIIWGKEPIHIALEDVFFVVSPRDDEDWSKEAVERRELAAKKAKLAAAELTKLSRRVSCNKGGWSFISYLTTKVLENIQVSIKNFHVLYSNMHSGSEQISFGLRFSSLTISKQHQIGGQLSETEIDIGDLELYCCTTSGADDFSSVNNIEESLLRNNSRHVGDKFQNLMEPSNVSVSLLVSRSDKLNDDLPQYSISAKLTGLVMSLSDVHLRQILILLDYLSTSPLRERYGRYRPWSSPLSKKDGWQRLWWRYAQESILSDVHKKLRKSSWRYLGQRLTNRRNYVSLYKTKLGSLQRDQPIDKSVHLELEQIEKESDIDDILSYRSAAEHELQELLADSSAADISSDKSRKDDRSSSQSRGWLNWLSRGMLGAGGTDDSSQFSGVVSDEVVQDIYEATKFHPPVFSGTDSDENGMMNTCTVEFGIDEISLTIWNSGKEIAKLDLHEVAIECKIEEEISTVIVVHSGDLIYPCNKKAILTMSGLHREENVMENEPSYRIQVDVSPNQDVKCSVVLQSLEISYETGFILDLVEFVTVLKSFEFQPARVLYSLDWFEDDNSRLLAKAEYILSNRKKVEWDVSVVDVVLVVPLTNTVSEQYDMALELGSVFLTSKSDVASLCSSINGDGQLDSLKLFMDSVSPSLLTGFRLQDLYNHFQIKINDFEIKLVKPLNHSTVCILEKFCASVTMSFCIVHDEVLQQLEVNVSGKPLLAHISPLICESIVVLIALLDNLNSVSEPVVPDSLSSLHSCLPRNHVSGFKMTANFEAANILVDLANDADTRAAIMISVDNLNIRYAFKRVGELLISSKALEIIAYSSRTEKDGHVLCSSKNPRTLSNTLQHVKCNGLGYPADHLGETSASSEECFLFHYEIHRLVGYVHHRCKLWLSDVDLHCYPYVFGLLMGFFDKIRSSSRFVAGENYSCSSSDVKSPKPLPQFEYRRFGFSNFSEEGVSECASIALDLFPFTTIYNFGTLTSLEDSIRYSTLDWRRSLILRDSKFESPRYSGVDGLKNFPDHQLKSKDDLYASFVSGNVADIDMYAVDVNLSGIRVHLHDSSCIVGIIEVPNSQLSICIHEDSMDLMSSTEGLSLTSSWWTKNFHDFMCGPSLPNLSPILNVRVRKGGFGSLDSSVEISIGIQHMCCVLPPEYLSILIGYFSLPDWSSNSGTQPVEKNHMDQDREISIVYKWEILDSTLICPAESNDHQFLKVELKQIYGSFIPESDLSVLFEGIPPECMVPAYEGSKTNISFNIFGRDLSLSLLLFKDDVNSSQMFLPGIEPRSITLISSFSADVWVRISSEFESSYDSQTDFTSIMSKIDTCELNLDEAYSLDGFFALLDIINHFSVVGDESKSFTLDVLQFLQSNKSLKERGVVSPVVTAKTFMEVRCFIESLSVQLHHLGNDLVLLEPVAKVDMKFRCFASLVNDTVTGLELNMKSLTLFSLLTNVMLAKCGDSCSAAPVFSLSFSKSDLCANELNLALPSLQIFVHSSDWTKVIDLLNSYSLKVAEITKIDSSTKSLSMNASCSSKNVSDMGSPIFDKKDGARSQDELQIENPETVGLIIRSENIGITVRFPIWLSEESLSDFEAAEIQQEMPQGLLSDVIEGKRCKFLTVTTHSKSSELLVAGKVVKVKCVLEKTSCAIVIIEHKSVNSWPFFHVSLISVESEISTTKGTPPHVAVQVQCDRLDVWLSHEVLFFWHDLQFQSSEPGSSEHVFVQLDLSIQLRKGSLLLSDGRWSSSGPLLEILLRNLLVDAHLTEIIIESTVVSDLQVNYNNLHKVFWEPLVEPWKFQISVNRKLEMNSLLDSSFLTDIDLMSTAQLNFNLTEPSIETVLRTVEMFKNAWGQREQDHSENQLPNSLLTQKLSGGSNAPYILQNLTSLPLVFRVYKGQVDSDRFNVSQMRDGKYVQPGATVPIHLNDTPEEQLFRYKPVQSSDKLSEKQPHGVSHHLMTIQLDGSPVPSAPVSIDLVGVTYFEVDFSNALTYNMNVGDKGTANTNTGFFVPVVFDVSVQRYSKLIRLYSTVTILNATSMPLELRFDIPFGIAPKILDPIYPGQEFPLPLHLAEAGRMRWRPVGNSYLWSEVHNLYDILSQESKIGFLRSLVCYPSHPSSDPFRSCFSVKRICLPTAVRSGEGSMHPANILNRSVKSSDQTLNDLDKSNNRFIHQVTLSSPLIVNNYLPEPVSLKIESCGVTCTTLLSEVVTSFHHIDLSHDLVLGMDGFRPSVIKFPRSETFTTVAKFSGTKFTQTENMAFDSDLCSGPTHITVEKTMDAFSGARELFIYVPFLLYNCTAIPLIISECTDEMKGTMCTMPSCYDLSDEEPIQEKRSGLSILFSDQNSSVGDSHNRRPGCAFSKKHAISTRNDCDPLSARNLSNYLTSSGSSEFPNKKYYRHDLGFAEPPSDSLKNRSLSITQLMLKDNGFVDKEQRKVKACIFSPHPTSASNEIMVRLRWSLPGFFSENMSNSSWSAPFPLVPPSGSMNVLVPQLLSNGASIISVACSAIGGQFAGRTRAITFQPRYVISNASSKDLDYKQKGTDVVFSLGVGHHSQLQWTDTTRDLLLSMRFTGTGWQWSGSFLPDHLGDTQVKFRNYDSGEVKMMRVEVQNADVFVKDEKAVGTLHGSCGTNLILLSEDNTGFMPYRIDNFSKEKLRIYQQRCESFDTIVHPYTSCPYAWDEPCFPHRLTVEVPGERIVGSYALDDLKEFIPVQLQSTFEKPERTLLLSIHAEGATKVLSIIDSSYHVLKDKKDLSAPRLLGKRTEEKKQEQPLNYRERFSVNIACIGISLINSYPQELLFACAKNIKLDLLQSVDQQTLVFSVSSLQIDNQLRTTPYPVILSFNKDSRSNQVNQMIKDDGTKYKNETGFLSISGGSGEPVVSLNVAKWRKKDDTLVSFQNIRLRVADFCLELEQELILSLLYLFKAQSQIMPFSDSVYSLGFTYDQPSEFVKPRDELQGIGYTVFGKSDRSNVSFPSIVPIGAPWQNIYLLASRKRKIYVESLNLDPIKFTLSFSSSPWMLRNGVLTSGESLIHRGLMALADVEGARIHLKELTVSHQLASVASIQEILVRHYSRQLLHEIYKVFGSAGVIGNPMGFARSLSAGIKDFLSVPVKSIMKSPTGLITGMAQGTTSLVSNTVYALSDATTQFSKAAHKGIVAFTFDDQAVRRMENQKKGEASHSNGVINEVFQGLTGLLQTPIKEVEKHGIPGILSGIALGVTGLVARPAASILEVTGQTAQSIRNRSKLHKLKSQCYRVRLPRILSQELPLRPYSWEEAVGTSVLIEADDGLKLKEETFVMCKSLKQPGEFVIITERLVLVVSCRSLVDLGKPEFRGVPVTPEWVIETEISLHSVIHTDLDNDVVHIVGSSADTVLRQSQNASKKGGASRRRWNNPSTLPLLQTNLELASKEDAEEFLQVLLSTIEQGKERGWDGGYLLHRSSIR